MAKRLFATFSHIKQKANKNPFCDQNINRQFWRCASLSTIEKASYKKRSIRVSILILMNRIMATCKVSLTAINIIYTPPDEGREEKGKRAEVDLYDFFHRRIFYVWSKEGRKKGSRAWAWCGDV